MSNTTNIELIERYWLDELTEAERAVVETRLETEPEFAKEVAQYGELIMAMKSHGREADLRAKLKSIHRSMEAGPLKTVVRPKSRLRSLPAFITTGAAAAGVAVLVMLTMGKWIIGEQEPDPGLQVLVDQMEHVNSRVDSLLEQQNPEIKNMDVSFGTGFPVSSNGYLITSHHIVKGAERVFIELPSGARFKAEMVYSDPTKDLAVLKTEDTNFTSFGSLPYSFASKPARLGDYVYTLGYPKQGMVFTEGSVSSLTGFNEDTFAYQVSVPANPGNSGGPLLDDKGRITGLVSGKHSQQEGAAFATKSDYVLNFLEEAQSAFPDLSLPRGRSMSGHRADQVEKLTPFIYKVRVYSK
jgi:S1-C subfamily serine protease